MKILLISVNREEMNMRTWPLGAACVAASVQQAGHTVELLDLMHVGDPIASVRTAIREFHPDVVGVSVRNIDSQKMSDPICFLESAREIVAEFKALTDAPVVLGGAGYSIYPVSLLEYLRADMGIQGEGEMSFLDLIDRLEQHTDMKGVSGLYLPGSGLQGWRRYEKDLDSFPLPDARFAADSIFAGDDFWFPVQTRRGCPMNCSYCSTAAIEGCLLRKRSPLTVVKWLSEWVKLGLKRYYFVDNTFNLPPSYAKTLCEELIDASWDIRWRCILYPVNVNEELVRLMAAAGCMEVSLGFESGSELILQGMKKKFSPKDVNDASDLLGEFGIRRMGFLLLGGPGETKESALESLRFADSLNLESLKLTVGIRIYPGTSLAQIALREGIIAAGDDLLQPRFYMAHGLGGWLKETVDHWMLEHPNWMR